MVDKRCTLAEAVSLVHDGASVTFSGFGHSLQPLAFCRELVRQGRRRLHLLTMGGVLGRRPPVRGRLRRHGPPQLPPL